MYTSGYQSSISSFRVKSTSLYSYDYGMGVDFASLLLSLSNRSSMSISTVAKESKYYTHTIAIDLIDKNENTIWKGETTWDSFRLDIRPTAKTALQILFSVLPKSENVFPHVPEIEESKVVNYYRLYCEDSWFSCPALPYSIEFGFGGEKAWTDAQRMHSIKQAIKSPEASSAFIDLIRTAEYALPTGSGNYDNPIDNSLWSKVMLGGKYYLGTQRKQINILISLAGESSGYVIDECWIASDVGYAEFEIILNEWKEALREYYNVYK